MAALLLIFFSCCAATPEEQFKSSNEAYRLNHFKDAAQQYEALIKEGYVSGSLYYNLGDAYYRMNKTPQSILYFEKAKLLMPSDEDLEHNLKLANLGATDKIEAIPELSIITFFKNLVNWKSSSHWAVEGIICLWISLLFVVSYLFSRNLGLRKLGFYVAIVLLVFAAIHFLAANERKSLEEKKYAIIFAPVSYVKSSPEESGKDAFYIHSGTKVEVKDHVSEWINIRLADGKTGWIKKDEAEEI